MMTLIPHFTDVRVKSKNGVDTLYCDTPDVGPDNYINRVPT